MAYKKHEIEIILKKPLSKKSKEILEYVLNKNKNKTKNNDR